MDQKVSNLQNENKELKSLIAKQNVRLEKLEEIALALKLRKDLEVISMAQLRVIFSDKTTHFPVTKKWQKSFFNQKSDFL